MWGRFRYVAGLKPAGDRERARASSVRDKFFLPRAGPRPVPELGTQSETSPALIRRGELSDKPLASRRDVLTRLLVEDILRQRELRCGRMAAYGRTGSTVREELHDYLGGLRVQLGAEERHLAADVWAGVLRD